VELAFRVEQIGVAALVRERACGKRSYKLLRGFGQHAADADLPLFQPADQVERLIGGNAAADDERDPRPVERIRTAWAASRGLDRTWGGLWRPGCELVGHTFDGLPQDHPDLLLDRAAIFGRAQPQVGLDGLVELA